MEKQPPNAKAVFDQVLGIESRIERAAYLDQACVADPQLRHKVEALLAAYEQAGSFLEAGPIGMAQTINPPLAERPGTVIGPYKLLEQIGEGGMGTVFMAEQSHPVQRKVALKVIKAGMDSGQVIARFEAERQALALMDHPNIAKVLDAGTTGGGRGQDSGVREGRREDSNSLAPDPWPPTPAGRPYFVMELVKGVPITQYCDENHLPPKARLELFTQVCQAVQHAHQKGIIHRDLKPTNVLVALYDDKPVPKVIDFGVAKATGGRLTERTMFTCYGQIVGTIEYMSPEQARLNALDVDTRGDIYSLGVLLYELLTGTTPFDRQRLREAAFDEMLRMIREEEPPKPSTRLSDLSRSGEPRRTKGGASAARLAAPTFSLASIAANRSMEPAKLSGLVRGELDWIVMKALEKDRNRRYESANGFAMDVQRYLADEPVQACPPSAAYRLRKFARRNKAGLGTTAVIGLAMLLVVGTIGWTLRDRQAGHLRMAGEVKQFLHQAESFYVDNKLPDAVAEVQKAHGLLEAGSGDEDLERRVRQWLTDLDTAAKLEEFHLESFDLEDRDRKDAEYARVFRDYGINVETLPVEEVVARITASQIRLDLVLGLGNWAGRLKFDPRPQSSVRRQRLLSICRTANNDPWQERLSRAVEAEDVATLRELANGVDPGRVRTRTLVHLGYSLKTAGDVVAAVSFLRKVQRQHPGDFMINSLLALSLSELQAPPLEDVIAFRRVALAARPQSAWAHYRLGAALGKADRHVEAIVEYRDSIRLEPGYAFAHTSLGESLRAQGNLDEAIVCHRKAIELDPNNVYAHYNLGKALLDQKKLDEAIACYRKSIEINPNAIVLISLGYALQDQQKLDEAIDCFRKAIQLDPEYAKAYYALGLALDDQMKMPEAIAAYRKAIQLDPKYAWAHNNLGKALLGQKELDEAIACFRKASDLNPNDVLVHFNLGISLKAQGKLDEAIACYRKTIELEPKNASAHNDLGVVLAEDGKPNEAIECYRRAIEIDPHNAIAHCNLGNSLKTLGNLDEAIACYKKAIELDPQSAKAHFNLGFALKSQEKTVEAIVCFRRAIEFDPKYVKAHYLLGNALKTQGNVDEAIACYRRAIEIDPQNAIAHYNLGVALRSQGKAAEGIECYRRAIALDPKDVKAHNSLGNALRAQGKVEEAIDCYKKAIALIPKVADFHNNLGCILCDDLRDYENAAARFRKAIELDPKHAKAYYNLGNALNGQNKFDEAIAAYRQAVKLDPKYARARSRLGNALLREYWANPAALKLRDPKQAVELLKEAVQLDSRSCLAWQLLGWVHYWAGNWAASIEALDKSCQLQPGGTGDSFQWIVLALAHARLATHEELPAGEQARHQREARRWYEQADKIITSRWQARPSEPRQQAVWDFHAEAKELMTAKDDKE